MHIAEEVEFRLTTSFRQETERWNAAIQYCCSEDAVIVLTS